MILLYSLPGLCRTSTTRQRGIACEKTGDPHPGAQGFDPTRRTCRSPTGCADWGSALIWRAARGRPPQAETWAAGRGSGCVKTAQVAGGIPTKMTGNATGMLTGTVTGTATETGTETGKGTELCSHREQTFRHRNVGVVQQRGLR